MCYSKEVSLVTSAAITAFSSWYYVKFYLKHQKQSLVTQIKGVIRTLTASDTQNKSTEFSLWFILAFAAIGGHQFGEFASIATGSQFIYKIGLISSILCTYFMMVAFERLSGKRLGSTIIAIVIFLVAIDIFRTEMAFENAHFLVRGFNHTYWAVAWLANWVYLCSAIFYLGYKAVNRANRKLYWIYGLGSINISFLLSWVYAIVAHRYGNVCSLSNCSYTFLQDFIFTYDFPSLWCTFTVIQAPFMYLTLRKIHTNYKIENFGNWQPNWITKLGLISITIGLMFAWYNVAPMLLGVSWKMMSKQSVQFN